MIEENLPPPKEALAALKPGQVSLRWETVPLGPKNSPVGVHVACKPPKGTKRDDIGPGTTVPADTPFIASIWWAGKKINEVRFTEDGDCSRIDGRWLDAKKRIPVLLLRFGVGDTGEWLAFVFVRGWQSAPVTQTFGFAENSSLDLEGRDTRGFWQVKDSWTDDKGVKWEALWTWNGKKFVETKPKRLK